MYSAVLESGSN